MSQSKGGTAREAPGTRRAAGKAEKRQRLIDATIVSIATYGLTGTTLARVTEIAGTSVGLAILHFESKERLFEAVLSHLADEQRSLWKERNVDTSLSNEDRLMDIIDSRFHRRICDRKKLAIWFAFYGDASARDLYRKVLSDVDDERLYATEAILKAMIDEGGYAGIDPAETALAMEALYDGLWLNMLLYPSDFKRLDCRSRALQFIAAILPRHFQNTTCKG